MALHNQFRPNEQYYAIDDYQQGIIFMGESQVPKQNIIGMVTHYQQFGENLNFRKIEWCWCWAHNQQKV